MKYWLYSKYWFRHLDENKTIIGLKLWWLLNDSSSIQDENKTIIGLKLQTCN